MSPTSTATSESLIVEKEIDTQIEVPELAGRRLVDVKYLFEQLSAIDHRPFDCTFKDFKFVSENRQGFYSTFKFDCAVCNAKVVIKSDRSGREVNQQFVHGIITSGNGFAQLDEFCAHVDMPCMSDKLFIKENVIFGNIIKDAALQSMHQAGIEERELAIAKGHVDNDGNPYITVVVDGSWAKRSYRTNYNSLSGVSCIIGFETKKVLFLGIRNAYCCVCTLAKNKNTVPKEHRCFKNWAKSSTAMEADGIVEGFKCSLDMHKIKYTTIIGDGDSSVTSALNESLPYGHMTSIKKIECSNHLLRNYCTKLKNLTKKTDSKYGSVPVKLRKLLDTNILRLRKAVKGAVDHTSKLDTTMEQKLNILKQDLLNSPCHVFGDHDKCKAYFCKGGIDENVVPEMKKCGLWYEIYSILNHIVTNAESLLMAQTNNIAEQFNSIIAKFIGGKRVNYCLRGSYEMRCFAAAAKQNTGNLVKTLAKGTEISAKYLQRHINKNKRKADTDGAVKLRKRNVAVADEHYGNLEKEADIPCDIFNKKKEEFMLNLQQSVRKRHDIQEMTKGQGSNQEWLRQRKIRLTASYFGQVCKLRSTTSCKNVVKQLLYNKFKGNDATKYGTENEPIALKDAEKLLGLHIEHCGLFIDEKRPYLGASPDGLIDDDAIVEIKCPSSASNFSPTEAIDKKKIDFCTIDGYNSNKIKLKRNHNYFYQVQGQLQITDRKYCIFIVWTPKGLAYEKIEKDNEFWNSVVSKLEEFYFKCILPELIDPRLPRNLPIRDRF